MGRPGQDETGPAAGPAANEERTAVAVRSIHATSGEASSAIEQPSELPRLSDTIGELSGAFGELRALLGRSQQFNTALESDLRAVRRQAAEEKREREKLLRRIERYQQQEQAGEETRAELEQVRGQRDALACRVKELGNALSESARGAQELGRLLQQCEAERDQASENALGFQSQFDRAVKVIEQLRREASAGRKREQQLESGARELQARVDELASQRDTLRNELSEARSAMEYIRQSILAAGRDPQGGLLEG